MLVEMVVPTRCFGCSGRGINPCRACIQDLGWPPGVEAPTGIDRVVTLCSYRGRGRDLIAAVKFGNDRPLTLWAGDRLADAVAYESVGERGRDAAAIDRVTWIPARRERRRQHGFDPGSLLARRVARRLEVPAQAMFRRGPGQPQAELNRADRLVGPAITTRARIPRGGRVLLIDDVMTTGATLRVAAAALRRSGVEGVDAAVLAVTPPPGDSHSS